MSEGMNIMEWVREILRGQKREDLPTEVSEKVVEKLIAKGAGEPVADESENPEENDNISNKPKNDEDEEMDENFDGSGEDSEKDPEKERVNESCSFAMRRNIVASLEEIRRFAEEHRLAASMVKAILTLLAEMALDALKGKVSVKVLGILLNALNFDKAKAEAYHEGELAGRNAEIIQKHFPEEVDTILPRLKGAKLKKGDSIFNIANDAR